MAKNEKIILTAIVSLSGIILFFACFLHDIPLRDNAHRYAPMAEAFAAGDWMFALHPRVPPLHVITSGMFAFITGLDGFCATKLSSVFWYFAGMFVLYRLVRLLFPEDRRIALWSTAMYAVFPYTIQMASYGLRESAKTFFLLLCALSLVRIKRAPSDILNYLLAGMACGLGTLIRVDTVLVSLAVLASAAFIESSSRKVPWMSMLAGLLQLAICLPSAAFNSIMFNTAVPDWRFAGVFRKFAGRMPEMPDFLIISFAAGILLIAAAWAAEKFCRKISVKYLFIFAAVLLAASSVRSVINCKGEYKQILSFCNSVYEGIYTFVGIFILIMVIIMWKKKKISTYENIVLAVWFLNAFLNIISIQLFENKLYVSSRYLHPAMALLFCFFVRAVYGIYLQLKEHRGEKKSKIILCSTMSLLAAAMVFHIFQPIIRDYTKKKNIQQRKKITALTEMIKKDYRPADKKLHIRKDPSFYHANRSPRLYFSDFNKISVAAYLAGGTLTMNIADADYIISSDESFVKKVKTHLSPVGRVNGYKRVFHVWRCEK